VRVPAGIPQCEHWRQWLAPVARANAVHRRTSARGRRVDLWYKAHSNPNGIPELNLPLSPPSVTFCQRFCLRLLGLFGWRTRLAWPPESKGIIIVYPHTSNWDFIIGLLFKFGHGLPVHWWGKDTLFRGPMGPVMRRLGGIPINRRERTGFIAHMKDEFASRDWLWVAVAPEGTRSRTDHLKTGFYQLALATGLSVGLAFIDYGTRVVGISEYIRFTGDADRDIATLRAFYADKQGRIQAQQGDIRFR